MANSDSVMWGGIIFFGSLVMFGAAICWFLFVLGPKIIRAQRKRQIETAILTGMNDAQFQQEVAREIIERKLKERR